MYIVLIYAIVICQVHLSGKYIPVVILLINI